MDELTLLRSARTDVPELSAESLAKGRAALLAKTGENDGRRATRSPHRAPLRWAGAGLGVLGATALIAGLVVTNVFGVGDWRGGAEPAAAEVLRDAALAAVEDSDPVIAPGQYLRVTTEAVNGSEASDGSVTVDQLFIPADRTTDWVWVRGINGDPQSAVSAHEEMLRAPEGAFYNYENAHSPGRLAALPRDPRELLTEIYEVTEGTGRSPDGEALVWIADTLRFGAVPADLRATLYNAAAMIPGVEITEQQANLNGTTGIAIGRLETVNGIRQDLIIDPVAGQLIGERFIQIDYDGETIGKVLSWTAITTAIVDAAPDGGTPNGAMDTMGCVVTGPSSFRCPPGSATDD